MSLAVQQVVIQTVFFRYTLTLCCAAGLQRSPAITDKPRDAHAVSLRLYDKTTSNCDPWIDTPQTLSAYRTRSVYLRPFLTYKKA